MASASRRAATPSEPRLASRASESFKASDEGATDGPLDSLDDDRHDPVRKHDDRHQNSVSAFVRQGASGAPRRRQCLSGVRWRS